MRVHLSEALGSTRKAIDGSLTAYELILNPQRATDYIDRDKFFLYIKANIKQLRINDPSLYPLAEKLIGLHELCSEFGSHADISTFVNRMQIIENNGAQKKMSFDYFEKPKNDQEFRFYFLCVLHAYFLMFKIFKKFFDRELHIINPNWEAKIVKLEKQIPNQCKAVHDTI